MLYMSFMYIPSDQFEDDFPWKTSNPEKNNKIYINKTYNSALISIFCQ